MRRVGAVLRVAVLADVPRGDARVVQRRTGLLERVRVRLDQAAREQRRLGAAAQVAFALRRAEAAEDLRDQRVQVGGGGGAARRAGQGLGTDRQGQGGGSGRQDAVAAVQKHGGRPGGAPLLAGIARRLAVGIRYHVDDRATVILTP